jgi:tetrapyrrole methylase family protein / MazG family protein
MKEFSDLVELMATLRGEKGCSWDKKQTVNEFKTFLLEEVYELIDSIDRQDFKAIEEELGDLLFHIVFIARILEEQGHSNIREVVAAVYDKMYKRHPHVFSSPARKEDGQVEKHWEQLKKEEKADYSLLAHIPVAMPALLRAYIVARRVARAGFDWESPDGAHDKLTEEINELREAERSGDMSAIKEEMGDTLFAAANIARINGIDPEDALRRTIDKFTKRFNEIESTTDFHALSEEELMRLWKEVKEKEKREG